MAFRQELESLINRYSQENGSDTPDFILARYIVGSLAVFNCAVNHREVWHGRRMRVQTTPVTGHGEVPPLNDKPVNLGR